MLVAEDGFEVRCRARANWRVRLVALGDDETEPMLGTVEERLAATWELTLQAWAIAGLPLPTYERHQAPVRMGRLGDESS
jgi:hypothetical protein